MGENSKIQWTHHTFNPWIGCTKVSPGCEHCYAEIGTFTRAQRAKGRELWGPKGARHIVADSRWREVLRWHRETLEARERRRVFCASMADVFEERDDLIEPRHRLFSLIEKTPGLDWLVLTKRPAAALRWFGGSSGAGLSAPVLPNLWIGTTVEDQRRAEERIPSLLNIPAAVRFLSCEPLLEPLNLRPWLGTECTHEDAYVERDTNAVICHRCDNEEHVDWVIVGGESGSKARPFNVGWARSIAEQCAYSGVSCFVKQLGADPWEEAEPTGQPHTFALRDAKGGDPAEWPADLRIRQFPEARHV